MIDSDSTDGRVFARLTLSLSLQRGGDARRHKLLLVLPLHVALSGGETTSLRHETIDISHIRIPSISSAVDDSRLSTTGRLVSASFHLAKLGYVLAPNMKIKPSNSTSQDLLLGLKSLSRARTFNVYMKASDYARQGLTSISQLLSGNIKGPRLDLDAMFGASGATILDWDNCILPSAQERAQPEEARDSPPPPYERRVLVRRTSSASPPRSPVTSSDGEHVSDSDGAKSHRLRLEAATKSNIEQSRTGKGKRRRSQSVELIPSPRPQTLSATPLQTEFRIWMDAILKVNDKAFAHSRLEERLKGLGQYIRESDTPNFYSTRAQCSAIFFYDPYDLADHAEISDPETLRLHEDLEVLIRWALRVHYLADSLLIKDFITLGFAARLLATREQKAEDYHLLRSNLVTVVLTKFGSCPSQTIPSLPATSG